MIPLMAPALAVNLYVASYAGNITSLSLLQKADGSYNLSQTSTFNSSTHTPSWLTLNKQNNVLYMVDEAVNNTNGTVVSYKTSYTGKLSEITRLEDIGGGVDATFFGSGSALAVPHYTGSALVTYNITSTGHLEQLQLFTYELSGPGTVPNRQDAPHPHQVVLDPTGQYLLINDLGADLVRVYSIGSGNLIAAMTPLKTKAGSGPRHGAFSLDPISGHYIYYLVAEIASTVTAYKVTYLSNNGGLSFESIGVYSSLSPGQAIPPTTTGESTGVAAEITVSPDGSTLIISNRRDLTFKNTKPPSDSISSFAISPIDGTLSFSQLFPAGGSYPRQFSLNRAGNLVAVGLQETGSVAILERDTCSGTFVKEVARIDITGGEVVCVVWDE
jgi:6-phosphogluconolactonase (cycloisomerase 2 family)